MIPSIHVLSNPISSLASVLFTHKHISPDSLTVKGLNKKRLEQLITLAEKKQETSRFQKTWEKYSLYQEAVQNNLSLLKNKNILFLDAINHTFEDKHATTLRTCIDDFASETITIPTLLNLYSCSTKPVKEELRKTVFYRIAPFEFPFIINEQEINSSIKKTENKLYAYNPFYKDINKINSFLEKKDKSILGSHHRYKEDISTRENHSFSSTLLSFSAIKSYLDTIDGWEYFTKEFSRKHFTVTKKEYSELLSTATRFHKLILEEKYLRIINSLELKEINPYMIQGAITLPILEKIGKKTNINIKIPGKKLLSSTKEKTTKRELEPQALRRLTGFYTAKYDETIEPIKIKTKEKKPLKNNQQGTLFPYIQGLGNISFFEKNIREKISKKELSHLEKDIKQYSFRIDTIEEVIYRLNHHNWKVHLDDGAETQWLDVLKTNTVNPFPIKHLSSKIPKRIIRPSNMGSRCELAMFIAIQEDDFWPKEIQSPHSAISGTTLHKIANEVSSQQHKELKKYSLKTISRNDYCEVPISRFFSPSITDWENAQKYLGKIQKKHSEYTYYNHLLNHLTTLKKQKPILVDAGSPDGMAIIEETKELVAIDFKRRMKLRTPIEYFFEQTARYALMLKEHVSSDNFYSLIIQRPFSFLQEEKEFPVDKGQYRSQAYVFKKISFQGEFIKRVISKTILEYASNTLLSKQPELLTIIQKERNHQKKLPLNCKDCFSNQENDYSCHFLLTQKKGLWKS
jgi:hypothetical protein